MLNSNYSKQLSKRQRIKETTLVVGMDIGYNFNAMALMNKEGQILGRYPRLYNSRNGFDYFVKVIESAKEKNGLKDVLIGLEPTGHYWRKIAYFSKSRGYEVRFVRTTALKHQRELDESSSAKSDVKDAFTIANITREGKYIDTIIEDGIYRQLRTLSRLRERIQKYNIGSKNALRAVLDDYFPELKNIFRLMNAKGLWAILENCPFPEDALTLGRTKIADIIAKSSRRKAVAAEKASVLYQAAGKSIGLKQIGTADRYKMKMFLEEVKRSEAQIKELGKEMEKLLKQVPYHEYLLSLPGVGPLSAAVFLGELGNPFYFKTYKQIIKYAGYDPIERDSGQYISRRMISKKGRWLLRKYLYFMAMRAIQFSPYFKEYYHRKLDSKRLSKKQALCATVIKLVKVLSAVLRKRRMFTEDVPTLNPILHKTGCGGSRIVTSRRPIAAWA